MYNKYSAILIFLFASYSLADSGELEIKVKNDNVLSLKGFNEKYGGWSKVEYKSPSTSFLIYDLPTKESSGVDVVASTDEDMVSPDKKYILIQRTSAGVVTDDKGKDIISEQTYCDMLSLADGCLKNVGSALQCDGSWAGGEWKPTSESGGSFEFSKSGMPPKKLISDVSRISSSGARASALSDLIFMGVPSYMACYPPQGNVAEYNDLGYFFSEGGENLIAMQIYERLLVLAPDRIPLKLNVADSFWALGKRDESVKYYVSYRDAMLKKGLGSKVPSRVEERIK
ncbi:tetratricopeptide repeat protein [Pseudomonas alliivorans]|nr:tetratricopeptide repeat protein [Pseudomonas alliivorans]MEE5083168.1 tetratricopeptide repeat protein [Pseudomonas alliivorans]